MSDALGSLGFLLETKAFLSKSDVFEDLDSMNTSASSLRQKEGREYQSSAQYILGRTHKSMTARHIAASSKSTLKLCSTSEGTRPMSETLTENSGFPVALATLSTAN